MGGMISTVIVCLLIAAAVFFAVRSVWRSHKSGRCCGCSGGACSGCTKCRDFDEELRKAGVTK